MKRKVVDLIPIIANFESYNDFKALHNTSNLDIGLDNIPLSDDDIATVEKELWKEIMSNEPDEDAIVTFKECMELLKDSNVGFHYEIFHDTSGKCTGCAW